MTDSIRSYLDRARWLHAGGDVDQAIGLLREALRVVIQEKVEVQEQQNRLHVNHAVVLYALGKLLRESGRNDEAGQAFRKVVGVPIEGPAGQELAQKAREELHELERPRRDQPGANR